MKNIMKFITKKIQSYRLMGSDISEINVDYNGYRVTYKHYETNIFDASEDIVIRGTETNRDIDMSDTDIPDSCGVMINNFDKAVGISRDIEILNVAEIEITGSCKVRSLYNGYVKVNIKNNVVFLLEGETYTNKYNIQGKNFITEPIKGLTFIYYNGKLLHTRLAYQRSYDGVWLLVDKKMYSVIEKGLVQNKFDVVRYDKCTKCIRGNVK